jgi:hypothetical protein
MWVKPGQGLIVRDPRTKQLIGPQGVEVTEHELDFVRMLADGDVVECDPPVEEPEAPPAEKPPAPAKPAAKLDTHEAE